MQRVSFRACVCLCVRTHPSTHAFKGFMFASRNRLETNASQAWKGVDMLKSLGGLRACSMHGNLIECVGRDQKIFNDRHHARSDRNRVID